MFKERKKIKRIITHGGQAHLDDFLAVGLARVFWPIPIERRNPTIEELEDSSILVLDVGNRYEPENMNFDHHQDKNIPSTIILFSRWVIDNIIKDKYKLFVERELFSPNRITNRIFLNDVSDLDTKGPMYCNKHGIPLPDPITISAIKKFQFDCNYQVLYLVESHFMDVFSKAHKAIRIIDEIFDKKTYSHILKAHTLFIIEQCDEFSPWEIIEEAENYYEWKKHNPSIVIFPDDRGDGWGILRRNDAPGVDFSTLKDHPEVLFAHPNGFIFKTHQRIPLIRLFKILNTILNGE